jgi:hypothetical protein
MRGWRGKGGLENERVTIWWEKGMIACSGRYCKSKCILHLLLQSESALANANCAV